MDFLNLPIRLSGKVVEGQKRGRELGFPTANLDLTILDLQHLEDGVYAGEVEILSLEKTYAGAFSLGTNSTFGEETRRLEVFILDFSGNLYTQTLNLTLIKKLRNQEKYNSIDALVDQIKQDVQQVREVIVLS